MKFLIKFLENELEQNALLDYAANPLAKTTYTLIQMRYQIKDDLLNLPCANFDKMPGPQFDERRILLTEITINKFSQLTSWTRGKERF